MHTAVVGSSFASSVNASCAWKMERIAIECPNSITPLRVASSSHSGMPG
jgi:hypothetical protein